MRRQIVIYTVTYGLKHDKYSSYIITITTVFLTVYNSMDLTVIHETHFNLTELKFAEQSPWGNYFARFLGHRISQTPDLSRVHFLNNTLAGLIIMSSKTLMSPFV